MLQAEACSLNPGLFFNGFRQRRIWIDGKVSIIGMFFPEGVLRVYGEFFSSLKNVQKFFGDKFELLTGEFRAEPDNEARDLIHRFCPPKIKIPAFPGGGKPKDRNSL